jgi:hypothetical protein
VAAVTVDRLLRQAIAGRRLISFHLGGRHRIAEPHDYGIHKGQVRLFFYQIGGETRSGGPLGWRWADVDKISQLKLLEETFAGARATSSGQHTAWDQLYASVADRDHP